MQVADHQVVIYRLFCTPCDTNVQHWTEQVSWNRYLLLTVDPLWTRCTWAHLCVGRNDSWCAVCCYSTVAAGVFCHHQSQHIMLADHPLHTLASFPTCALTYKKTIIDPLFLTILMLSLISSTNLDFGTVHLSLERTPVSNTESCSTDQPQHTVLYINLSSYSVFKKIFQCIMWLEAPRWIYSLFNICEDLIKKKLLAMYLNSSNVETTLF